MSEFSKPKVLIDEAEYRYLKGLEALAEQRDSNAITEMYEHLLGITLSRMPSTEYSSLKQYLETKKITWVHDTLPSKPQKFVIKSIQL